ncbi:hypothetical protein [Piscirickettsia salmonis]|nr:hypothetical protein [Piscirickettsia salmonis]ERL62290.1 hypothetical protein K661_01364 [Piscirickettsia salmonis LF-89 = ATCC VR-1361]
MYYFKGGLPSPLKNRVRMKLDQDEINLETALSQVMKSMSETIR